MTVTTIFVKSLSWVCNYEPNPIEVWRTAEACEERNLRGSQFVGEHLSTPAQPSFRPSRDTSSSTIQPPLPPISLFFALFVLNFVWTPEIPAGLLTPSTIALFTSSTFARVQSKLQFAWMWCGVTQHQYATNTITKTKQQPHDHQPHDQPTTTTTTSPDRPQQLNHQPSLNYQLLAANQLPQKVTPPTK